MTHVTGVTVRFSRKRQAAQFEPAEAEVTINVSIDEASPEADPNTVERVAAVLLAKAAAAVYSRLGINVAPSAEPATVSAPVAEGTAAPVVPLQKRTRRTKEQIAAGEAAANTASPTTTASNSGSTPTPAAGTATPAAPSSAPEPWETEAPAPVADKVITDNDLQAAASKAAAPTSIGGPAVKALMVEFKVGRLGELDQPRRRDFIAKLAALVAAKGA